MLVHGLQLSLSLPRLHLLDVVLFRKVCRLLRLASELGDVNQQDCCTGLGMMSKSVALYREDGPMNEIEEFDGYKYRPPRHSSFRFICIFINTILYYIQDGTTNRDRQRWIPTEPGPDHEL
jgi:hypothetical protein